MIVYDGTYRLRGDAKEKRIGNWAYSWRLRIINLSMSQPDVLHLRPIIVVAAQTGEGIFKANCAESIGKRICRDFDLNIREILWIEQFHNKPESMHVASFDPKLSFGHETFYSISWRHITPNELETISPYIPEAGNVKI